MYRFLNIMLAFLLCRGAQAQSIKGSVKSQRAEAITAATIHILNTNYSAIADNTGTFSFSSLSAGNYLLSVSGFPTGY